MRNTAALVGSSVLAVAMLSKTALAQVFRPADEGPSKAERPTAPRPARGPEIVYLNAEGGLETITINSLTAAGSIATRDIRPATATTTGVGPFYGVGGGVRLGFLTLGGRVRGTHFDVGDLSTIDGELGARINLRRYEPYFTFGAGYAKLQATGAEVAGIRDLDIHGWNARLGFGLDYYADKNVTVGVNFTGDLLAMARPGIDLSTSPEAQARTRIQACEAVTDPTQQQQCASNIVHDTEGASAAFAGAMSFVLGLHF
jgi:hypothetical protein